MTGRSGPSEEAAEPEADPGFESLSDGGLRLTRRTTAEIVMNDATVQSYLLKPTTWPARLLCLTAWAAALCGLLAACYWLVPLLLRKVVVPVQEKVRRDWSPVAVAFFVIAGVACVPTVLLPAAPFIWLAAVSLGVWKGYLVVQAGTLLGMSLSYCLGRLLLRQRIRRWVEHKEWAQALFMAVKEAGPFKVVLLMRLGPAPYAWLSYACSLSPDIQYLPYIGASVLGRSPHNLIDIYIGSGVSTAGEAAMGAKLDPWMIATYVIGFLLAVLITAWGYFYAKRALRDLRARALARDQMLTAFSFPELEELDDAFAEGPDVALTQVAGMSKSAAAGGILGRPHSPIGVFWRERDQPLNKVELPVSTEAEDAGESVRLMAGHLPSSDAVLD